MIYVGIDVSSDKHSCCIVDINKNILSEFDFSNSLSGFNFLLDMIYGFNDKINIGLEATGIYGDNLVNFLHNHNLQTITINPLSAKRFLNASSLRKTKTDKIDARGIAGLLTQELFNPDTTVSYHIIQLKSLTRLRNRLVNERSRHKILAKRSITILFPEFKSFFNHTFCATAMAVLSKYPSAKDLASSRIDTLTSIIYSASRGKYDRDRAVFMRNVAKQSIGTYSPAEVLSLKFALQSISVYDCQIKEVEKQIDAIMKEIDSPITSFPGIGNTIGAVILSEVGNIKRFSSASKLQAFAGLDPSMYQSGKYKANTGSMVKHGSPYLRNAIIQAAKLISRYNLTFATYLNKKIDEGKHYNVAISHVAKKLIRVIFHNLSNNLIFSLD